LGVRPTVKVFVILLLLLPVTCFGHDLAPVNKPELAAVLGLLDELATTPASSDQPYIVRVYAAPVSVGECDGTVASCPNVRLFITVSNGDLGEVPVLYQLPLQKGWLFVGWSRPVTVGRIQMASLVLRTTVPGSNIEPAARNAWRSQTYRVLVSPASSSYVVQ